MKPYRILVRGMWLWFALLAALPVWSVALNLDTLQTKVMVPLEPLLGLYVLAMAGVAWLRRKKLRLQGMDIGIVLFLAAALLSALLGRNLTTGLKAFIVLAAYIAAFYATWRILPPQRGHYHRVWQAYLGSFAMLMGYSLANGFLNGFGYHQSYDLAQPFSQGHTLLVAMGFPAFLYALDRAFRIRCGWMMAFVALFGLFVLLSFSRLYWLGLPLFGFLFLLRYLPRWRPWLLGTAAVILVAGTVSLYLIKQHRDAVRAWDDPDDHKTIIAQVLSITSFKANDSNLDRLNRWKIGMMMFHERPLTGIGLNGYAREFNRYPTQVTFYGTERQGQEENAHNLYLGWLSEMGLAGALAGALLLLLAWHHWYRHRSHADAFLLAMLLVNFMLLGLVEDFLFYEKVAPYWWMGLGMMAGVSGGVEKGVS